MEIIGLSGYARSGKDEAAKVLVEEFGFTRIAFADKLRDVLYALNPIVSFGWKGKSKDFPTEQIYLRNVIDRFGWGGYKETIYGPEIRRLLQRLGTEAGRQTLWDSIWIDAALTNLPHDAKVVVSDARFLNEFHAVIQRGGQIWRINREGVGPANEHASEMEALEFRAWAQVINNNGTLDEFRDKVKLAYQRGVYDSVREELRVNNPWF